MSHETKKQRASKKFRQHYGYAPPSDAALATYMTLYMTSGDFRGCSDAYVANTEAASRSLK